MKKRIVAVILSCFVFFTLNSQDIGKLDYTKYVNPFIGTAKFGHTFPGATVPFGMVQLSPDTDIKGWDYCAGYRYEDTIIMGFSHTHLSGTGERDLADVLIMPTTGIPVFSNGSNSMPDSGFCSRFSHLEEKASPGYYSVYLKDYDILAELTATTRCGFHQYTFHHADTASIMIDLAHIIQKKNADVVWSSLQVIDDSTIVGYRITKGWAKSRHVYFVINVSKPILSKKIFVDGNLRDAEGFGKQVKAYLRFSVKAGEKIRLKTAISPVSTQGAWLNLRTELPHWDFEETKSSAKKAWNDKLKLIHIETPNEKVMKYFYTAMYHLMIAPNTLMDVDGNYTGIGNTVHKANDFVNYSTFSLWDTYRAVHPLYSIILPTYNRDMIRSMLEHYRQNPYKWLPMWSLWGNETYCMSGFHSIPVITDAFNKGNISKEEAQQCLQAMVNSADRWKNDFETLGFVPYRKGLTSASNTMEQCFDDYAVAELAKKLGDSNIYNRFYKRSFAYENLFDTTYLLIRPRLSNGDWLSPFNPAMNEGFSEGNSYQYTFHVQHEIPRLIELMGGADTFENRLDSLFNARIAKEFIEYFHDFKDGNIGYYIHANEPCHHIPYLYNYTKSPWKTHQKVLEILERFHDTIPAGITGNEDCGQMSAWYIFSSLGFYPLNPVSNEFELSVPTINKAIITLQNRKKIIITVERQNNSASLLPKWFINGREIQGTKLEFKDIRNGATVKVVF